LLKGGADRPNRGSTSLVGFFFLKSSNTAQLTLLTYFNIPNERKTVGVLYRGHKFPLIVAVSGWGHLDDSNMNIQVSGKSWTSKVHRLSKHIGYDLPPGKSD
jgi:hypothetical protein